MTTSRQKNVEDLYPLSPMQQGMLFHTLYAPGSGVYVEQVSCTLRGDLNIPAFEQAWQQVVDRHPVLRTSFVWEDLDEPLQVVRLRVKLPWERHDWRAYPPDEQRERLAAFLQADRARGFKLSKAPLMRLALIQLAEDTYRFVWSHHHLLLDGWSLPLVLKEVFVVYEAHCRGQEPLLERSRPYRDYVEWLRRQPLHEAEAFWRQMLAGFSAPTPLVVERAPAAREEAQTYRTAQVRLSEATTAALHGLARAEQITLSTLVQGAWAMLLSRYSGMADVVFGLTVSGRPADLAGVETMVGLFINTLPLRVHVAAAEAARPWLKRLQARQFELRQFEYTPLVQVQSWSGVPRGQPLFESIVVFENYPVDEALGQRAGGVEIRDIYAVEQTNYPLALLALGSAGLTLQAIYDGQRFDGAAITRMLGHLQTLLDGIATRPERRLADLPLLTAAERQQALVEWNATRAAYPSDCCIHELFEQQVERAPDAIAVVFDGPGDGGWGMGDGGQASDGGESQTQNSKLKTQNHPRPQSSVLSPQSLTYSALNEWSNRLARQLRALEIGPGGLVAIYMDRVAAMVPALLGILKAGGAYVPLEPSFPEARVRWILASLQVRCVVTQAVYAPLLRGLQLPALEHLVCLDDDRQPEPDAAGPHVWTNAGLAHLPATNLPGGAGPENLAYIVFTSGSTGTPKGVMIQHRPVINLIDWVNRTFALGPLDQVLFITSLCFDLSVYDVFGLLAAGGAIRLASDGDIRDPQRLARMLREEPITFWDSAPAALQQLTPFFAPAPGDAPRLRLVFLSGDWIPLALPDLVRASFPRAEVIGLGGGTEATVWSNYYPIGAVEPHWVSIPYGKPIQNAAYYILDAHLNPCPIGVPGDLYIGGECLSCGYAGDPAQTAERFIPNPFWGMGDGGWGMEDSAPIPHPPSPGFIGPATWRASGPTARWSSWGAWTTR